MARETLLLVEDNDALRRLYRTALLVAGYRVTEAANGLDALRKVDQEHPDAIVLDLHLPEVSGLAVLQDLKQQVQARSIPVIVVTGLPWRWTASAPTASSRSPSTRTFSS